MAVTQKPRNCGYKMKNKDTNPEEQQKSDNLFSDEASTRRSFLSGLFTAGAGAYSIPFLTTTKSSKVVAHESEVCLPRFEGVAVSPTLELSVSAEDSPFAAQSVILDNLRDFLLRRNEWKNHTLDIRELFAIKQAPSVVGQGNHNPVPETLGFGSIVITGSSISCENHACEKQKLDSPSDSCDSNLCSWQTCENQGCNTNSCTSHGCGINACGTYTNYTNEEFFQEMNQNINHPFIIEMMNYLTNSQLISIGDQTPLAFFNAIHKYVGRNMFEKKLLSGGQELDFDVPLDIFSMTGAALATGLTAIAATAASKNKEEKE